MAKLKLWVRNLIIILAVVVSLVGVGVGLYFVLRPNTDDPGTNPEYKRELSEEQKQYIEGVSNIEQPDIDISTYDGIVLEDGTAVDTDRIVSVNGNYLVVENATTYLPEFYVLTNNQQDANPAELTSGALDQPETNNVVLKKITISSDYTHVINLFGDYAVVANSSDGLTARVVSLKTGDTVLTKDKFDDVVMVDDDTQPGGRYVGSYFVSLIKSVGNFMLVEKEIVTAYNSSELTVDFSYEYILYPLDNPEAAITFNESFGYLVTYKITDNYVVLVTTKHTYVYSTLLNADGQWVSMLPVLNNNFTATTGEDYQVESGTIGKFKDVVYHTIQEMPNGLILVEKNTVIGNTEEAVDETLYNVVYRLDVLNSKNVITGINYSIYSTTEAEYLQNIPDFVGKVEVLASKVPGYYVLNQTFGGINNNYANGSSNAYLYDANFNYVLKYDYNAFGDIIYYTGSHFITSGAGSSTRLDAWGKKDLHHVGYVVVSSSAYDGYVVVKNDKYYSLYNTVTGQIFSDNYLFISEIMNGKVFAFKEDTGYFEISLNTMLRTPIYNFDTTKVNGNYGLNLFMGSVGYYFTYDATNLYTYVGFNGVTYKNISSYKYKVIGNSVYLTLTFASGSSKLLVSNIMGKIASLTEEEITETYMFNQTPPAVQTTAVAVPLSISYENGTVNLDDTMYNYYDSSSAIDFTYDIAKIVMSQDNNGVPAYNIQIYSDLLNENGGWTTGNNDGGEYYWREEKSVDHGISITRFKRNGYMNFDLGLTGNPIGEYNLNKSIYYALDDWFRDNYGDGIYCPLPETISLTTAYSQATVGKDYYTQFHNLYSGTGMIGAIACKTPYGFVVAVRYGMAVYDHHHPGLNYADRVIVGLDENVFVQKGTVIETAIREGNIYDDSSKHTTIVDGSNAQYKHSEGSIDFPSLTYCAYENDYAALDLYWGKNGYGDDGIVEAAAALPSGWGINEIYDEKRNDMVKNKFRIGVYSSFQTLHAQLYCRESAYIGNYSGTDYRQSQYAGTVLNLDLTFTPFMSEYDRYHGQIGESSDARTITYGGYLKSNGDAAYGMFEVECSGSTSSDEHDSGHQTTFSYSLISEVSSKLTIKKLTLNISEQSTVTKNNIVNCSTGPYSKETWCWQVWKGNHTHYLLHPTTSIYATYSIDTDRYQDTGEIKTASASTNTAVSTGERLFVADTHVGQIKYGFWMTSSFGYTIGTQRQDLSPFTQKCTFGYKLNGLEGNGSTYFNDAGKYAQSFDTLVASSYIGGFTPSQSALTLEVKYNIIASAYDGDDLLASGASGIKKANYTPLDDKKETVSYNASFDLLAIGEHGSGSEVNAPVGYTFNKWYILSGEYSIWSGSSTVTASEAKGIEVDDTITNYFALVDGQLTNNAYAKSVDGKKTLELYATYSPKDYKITVNFVGSAVADMFLFVNNVETEVRLVWESEELTYGQQNVVIPLMHLNVDNIYYKIELVPTGKYSGSTRPLSLGGVDNRTGSFTVRQLGNYIASGSSFDNDYILVLNAVASPMEYNVTYKATQDSHVYSDSDNDLVNEVLQEANEPTIKEQSSNTDINIPTYGEAQSGSINFKSGNDYTISIANFTQGMRLKLTYTIDNIGTDNLAESSPNKYYIYYGYYDDIKGDGYNAYKDASGYAHTFYSSGDFSGFLYYYEDADTIPYLPFNVNVNPTSGNTLTITLLDIGGGVYTINNDGVGKFDQNKITLDIEIDSQLYTINTSKKENREGATEDAGGLGETDFSLSDQINYPALSGTNGHKHGDDVTQHYYGYGSTMLISTGASMYQKLHGSIYVPNQFLSGLKIAYNGTEKFAWDYKNLSEQDRTDFTELFINFAANPVAVKDDVLYFNGAARSIMYGPNDYDVLLNAPYYDEDIDKQYYLYEEFLQIMYGINPRDDGSESYANYISESMVVYYKVYPLTSGDTTIYLILTYHQNEGGISLGVSSAVLYTLCDDYVLGAQNNYDITVLYTNYDGVLTWNANNIGVADGTEFDTSEYTKAYFTAYDNSKAVFKTDANGNYMEILRNRVYVDIDTANNNRLKVNRALTDEEVFVALFGENGIVKRNYEPIDENSGYLLNYVCTDLDEGGNANLNGNVSVELDFNNSYYYDNEKLTTDPLFNFASTSPANSFKYNINVKNGYYINKVTINYNEKTYIIELISFFINAGQQYIIPRYKITTIDKEGNTNIAYNIDFADGVVGSGQALLGSEGYVERTLENQMLNVSFYKLDVGTNDANTAMSIEIGFITHGANISIEYGAYSLLATSFNDGHITDADKQHIAWNYTDGEIKILNNNVEDENSDVSDDNVVSTINFVDTTDNKNIPTRVFASSKYEGDYYYTLEQNVYTINGNQRIYFMVLDYKLAHVDLESPKSNDLQTYVKVNTTIKDDALYELVIAEDDIYTYGNSATWIYTNKDTAKTEQNIVNTLGQNFIASYTIKSKDFNTSITSDINFGTTAEDIAEEALSNNGYLTAEQKATLQLLDTNAGEPHTKFHYIDNVGEDAYGQIASRNTMVYLQQSGINFGGVNTKDYLCYGEGAQVQGNKLIYTIKYEYGYDFVGASFNAKILGVSEDTFASALLTYDVAITEPRDIVVNVSDTDYVLGDYLLEKGENEYILTINVTNAAITDINVDLHYNAKEFIVTYDWDQDFGTSYIDVNKTSTFTYNLISPVDKGIGPETILYDRIGYDMVGWAFADFYKGVDGKTVNTTNPDLRAEDLTEENYLTQLYGLNSDTTYLWYLSLGENLGNVFGTKNSADQIKEEGHIQLSAVWQAKTYTINFNYKDNTSGDATDGTTTSTKYTASWVFDMPIEVADIASENLSFENENFTEQNKLLNKISRVYRMGYAFNGWYADNSNTWADGTLIYNPDPALDNGNDALVLVLDTTAGKLGYPESIPTPEKVFGYNVYRLINDNSIWQELPNNNALEDADTSTFDLYAKWTANTYTFAYDLNAYANIADSGANGSSSMTWTTADTPSFTVNKLTGVGSSVATLRVGATGATSVVFDQNFTNGSLQNIREYTYRNGYKFKGWFASREDLGEDDFGLLEDQNLTLQILLNMLGIQDELLAVQTKATQTFENTSIVETVLQDAAEIYAEDLHDQLEHGWGNLMLLHARWEALPYTINIDLNNWNHPDYDWQDGDYIVDDVEFVKSNVVSDVQIVVLFDQAFNTCDLLLAGNKIDTEQQIEFVRNGRTYTTTGANGYEKLIQIITAHGYHLGTSGYQFTLSADGNGLTFNDVAISVDTSDDSIFDETMFTSAYYNDIVKKPGNAPSDTTLMSLDDSGDDLGDRHETDITKTEAFGIRTFTIYAYWTYKNVAVTNVGTREEYNNTLDRDDITLERYNTYQTIFYDQDAEKIINWAETANNEGNTYWGSVYNNQYTYHISPATGQYIQTLTIEFNDNYDTLTDAISHNKRGHIILEFVWDSVTHIVTIASARYAIGYTSDSGTFVPTVSGNFDISADGRSITRNDKLNYLFESINISTSKYKVVTTQNEKNINTTYTGADYSESADTWITGVGLKDINLVSIEITGVKSNMIVQTQTQAQTYQVDYYRYVRPFNQMQTHINEDSESSTFGEEEWDSQFLNDWDQYFVYKTVTYRYGEYVNTSYGYATNFGFGGWYYYQGHISNFQEYANYGSPDNVFETHESNGITDTMRLYDFLGRWGSAENSDIMSGKFLQYDWDSAAQKYICISDPDLMLDGVPVYGEGNVLTGYERYSYIDAADGNQLKYRDTLFVRSYTYHEDYKDYKFDSAAISGNLSIVGIYFPASIHKVHYYTWKDSSSTNTGYEERNASSNEYVLGQKHVAKVIADTNATELSRNFSYVEYWELGTNTQYYRVGFSGFNSISGGLPTEMSALEFLMQFVNPSNYDGYTDNFDNETQKLSISYSTLKQIIKDTYGIEGSTVKDLAVNLLVHLLTVGDYQVYNYLDNYEVLLNVGVSGFVPVAPVYGEDGVQTNYGVNILELARKLGINVDGKQPQDVDAEILAKLNVEQLLVLLDRIAIDYFGYILINPSANIGHWPQGTYLAGWYMIQEDLRKILMGEEETTYYNYVLTFNSDTFVVGDGQDALKCMYIVNVTEDHLGNKTYYVAFTNNPEATTYQITKFNTVDPITGVVDILSRVDTSVHIFAAYNTYKFEMTTNGVTDVDIQWGTEVLDLNGIPYQYTAEDVFYIALSDEQLEELEVEFSNNYTLPTALQTIITRHNDTINVTNNFNTAKTESEGKHIIAFVYNIEKVYIDVDADGNESQAVQYNEHINTVSTKALNKDADRVVDLLTLLLD